MVSKNPLRLCEFTCHVVSEVEIVEPLDVLQSKLSKNPTPGLASSPRPVPEEFGKAYTAVVSAPGFPGLLYLRPNPRGHSAKVWLLSVSCALFQALTGPETFAKKGQVKRVGKMTFQLCDLSCQRGSLWRGSTPSPS